jgi:tetratricopeptide (TPR) repeat protein
MRLLTSILISLLLMTEALAAPLPDFDKLWDYGNPAKSEASFRGLLPQARESGDRGYLAQLLTQIARAQGLQRRFEAAHGTLDEAEATLMAAGEPAAARVRYLLERGRVFNTSGDPAKAKPLFLQAWDAARAAGEDFHAVDAAHMLGIVEPPDAALDWSLTALALAEQSKNERAKKWLGALYNNIGWTYFDKKDYPRSLDLLVKAQAWYEQQKLPVPIRIARWSVAKLTRVLGKTAEALPVQQALEKEWAEAGEPDGYVFEEVAECHLALDHAAEAKRYFGLAYDLLSKDDDLNSEPERLARIKKLGDR